MAHWLEKQQLAAGTDQPWPAGLSGFTLKLLTCRLFPPLLTEPHKEGWQGCLAPQWAQLTLPSRAPSVPPSCQPPTASLPSPLYSLAFEIGRRHQLYSDDEKRGRSTCSCLGFRFRAVLVLNTSPLIWVLGCRRVKGGLLFSCWNIQPDHSAEVCLEATSPILAPPHPQKTLLFLSTLCAEFSSGFCLTVGTLLGWAKWTNQQQPSHPTTQWVLVTCIHHVSWKHFRTTAFQPVRHTWKPGRSQAVPSINWEGNYIFFQGMGANGVRANYLWQMVVGSFLAHFQSIDTNEWPERAWTFFPLTSLTFSWGGQVGLAHLAWSKVVGMSPAHTNPGSSPGLPMRRELITTQGAAWCHTGVAVGLMAVLTHSPGIAPKLISLGFVSLGTALHWHQGICAGCQPTSWDASGLFFLILVLGKRRQFEG